MLSKISLKFINIFSSLKGFTVFLVLLIFSCKKEVSPKKSSSELFNTYCATCHIAPNINDLPKEIWKNNILPEMGARLGIIENGFDPHNGLDMKEYEARIRSGVYPDKNTPLISQEDWDLIKKHILTLAPDSLVFESDKTENLKELTQFSPQLIRLANNKENAMMITYVAHNNNLNELMLGTVYGELFKYSFNTSEIKIIAKTNSGVISYSKINNKEYVTEVGKLDPSELVLGKINLLENDSLYLFEDKLHRPVHCLAEDLNNDGNVEFLVSEFGNLTGQLSLLKKNPDNDKMKKETLLGLPGVIRVISEDMNGDNKKDLVVLVSQGDEGVFIFYQEDDLKFKMERVIRLSPLYGSSWFELVDYNGDGHKDIIIANGDNADYSAIDKPYHGIRIFINNGSNSFTQEYFHPVNGATRVVANDFDKDNDLDFAVIATFPDYEKYPEQAFVYLENTNSQKYEFTPYTFSGATSGRWLLMESGDVDNDGDVDILLTPYPIVFPQTPKKSIRKWVDSKVDLMVLENNLINNK